MHHKGDRQPVVAPADGSADFEEPARKFMYAISQEQNKSER
jgi:hypothetical protein